MTADSKRAVKMAGRPGSYALLLGLVLVAAGWSARHLELLSSYPRKDQTVGTAPVDISLIFSESADSAKSSIALSGAGGPVPMAPVRLQDEGLVVLARVDGPMPSGTYTVSWSAAAPDQDPIRGTFRFTVRGAR